MATSAGDGGPVPVVIVGAGPVGLSLALGLARHGVRSVLLERESATSAQSKAGGLHQRSREIFRRWGVEARLLAAGELVGRLPLHDAGGGARPLSVHDLTVLEPEAERPGLLMLPQNRTEELLCAAVQESGRCEVRFGAEAVEVTQDDDGATVTVREAGQQRRLDARFVVGCDGAGSTVRDALGLGFAGITYSLRPLLADVVVDADRDGLPWPRFRNARSGLMFAARFQPGLWRIVRLDLGEPESSGGVDENAVGRRTGELLGLGSAKVVWASRFRIHRRAASRFRVGRVLLAGDAAHVQSPVGGQGMNAGIQDADNLAWKLAHALRGGDLDRLLDSYDRERRAVVVGNVSRYTDAMTRVFLQAPVRVRGAAFALHRVLMRSARLRQANARRVAMLDLHYPASPLLDDREAAAGRRLPNPLLHTADRHRVRLYDLLPTGAALLDIADAPQPTPDVPVDDVIRLGTGGYHDPSGALRELLRGADGWILVRPDTHIAWARPRREGITDPVRRALGDPG